MRCPHTVNVNYRWNEKKCSLGTPVHVISIFVSNLVFSLVFWTTLPASRGLYSMKKPREFVHNKCKAFFIISWPPFWTNIEYSHRVPTLIFFRNYCLRVDRHESVTKHQDFLVCPGTTDLQFYERLGEFFRGNSRTISDYLVSSSASLLPGI